MLLPYVRALSDFVSSNYQLYSTQAMIYQPIQQNCYQINNEKLRISERLCGFNAKESDVVKAIYTKFGANVKQGELVNIAQVIASKVNIKLDRDAKRRKTVLLKWFSENWSKIQPYLKYIVLEDDSNDS